MSMRNVRSAIIAALVIWAPLQLLETSVDVDVPIGVFVIAGLLAGHVAARLENRRETRRRERAAAQFQEVLNNIERGGDNRRLAPTPAWTVCSFCGSQFDANSSGRCPHCRQPANTGVVAWNPDRANQ